MEQQTKTATVTATETVTIGKAEYEALLASRENLQSQVDWLTEQMRLLQKKQFGSSSEKRMDLNYPEQLSIFNEAEFTDDTAAALDGAANAAADKTTVKAHTRRKSGSVEDVVPEGTPVEIIEHRLSEEERICKECGSIMDELSHEVRRTLVIIPAQTKVREEHFYTYACRKCEKENDHTPMQQARVPAVIPGSFASPEAIAHIMTQKFVMHSPLYRQAQELQRSGIGLTRQTMSNWFLHAAEDWLTPIYEELHKRLVKSEVLHSDETTLQVLKEPGKPAQSKSYMWLYRTGGDTDKPIVLYEYTPNRKPANAEEFLRGFCGYLHADGYQGYHHLPSDIVVVGCLAHARRKLTEAPDAIPKEQRESCEAGIGLAYMQRLYAIEESIQKKTPEERYKQRQEQSKPVFEALLTWVKTVKVPPKSLLGKAIYYLIEQEPWLRRYLEDGRLEIDNNRAERSIKPFVMSRKNFLFANTPSGARSSAVVFSLIQTAIVNGLDPYRYLTYVFTNAPILFEETTDWVTPLLPENAPEECRAKGE